MKCTRWGFPQQVGCWLKCVLAAGALLAAPVADAEEFEDVPSDHWAAPYVSIVTDVGLMEGCGGHFFCPDEPITREDMAVWLERGLHGVTYTPPAASGVFSDVDASYCLAPWIEQLYEDGITAGCSASPLKYCPHKPLSRAEMAVFLLSVSHGADYRPPACTPGNPVFSDVPCPGYWATDWIEQLYREGITGGCAVNPLKYCPYNQVTRAQMAVFLVGSFDLQ